MRMHRGSSKGVAGDPATAETLPLSASPPKEIEVELAITHAGRVELRRVTVPFGAPVRAALGAVGQPGEGAAVLLDESFVPLDLPITRPVRLTVVRTFSGG